MALAYSKEFLISAYLYRYRFLNDEKTQELYENAFVLYDDVGKTEFRKWASLDAEAIKKYKLSIEE